MEIKNGAEFLKLIHDDLKRADQEKSNWIYMTEFYNYFTDRSLSKLVDIREHPWKPKYHINSISFDYI